MMPATPFYQAMLAGAAFCTVMAVSGGLLTQLTPWYDALRKPSWKPPDWAFGPIWTCVFICLTLAIAYAWDAASTNQRIAMLWALGINGVLNVIWSGIFFVLKNPALAFAELLVFWISIAVLVIIMGSISRTAGVLLLPYILWVSAAGVLNFQIVRLNRA
jgi:tryptophan-rich sensory protein